MRADDHDTLIISATDTGGMRLVRVIGEVDLSARTVMAAACLGGEHDIVIDLSEATFMDCAGYAALLLARQELVDVGGTVTFCNAIGQPERLLQVIARMDAQRAV